MKKVTEVKPPIVKMGGKDFTRAQFNKERKFKAPKRREGKSLNRFADRDITAIYFKDAITDKSIGFKKTYDYAKRRNMGDIKFKNSTYVKIKYTATIGKRKATFYKYYKQKSLKHFQIRSVITDYLRRNYHVKFTTDKEIIEIKYANNKQVKKWKINYEVTGYVKKSKRKRH